MTDMNNEWGWFTTCLRLHRNQSVKAKTAHLYLAKTIWICCWNYCSCDKCTHWLRSLCRHFVDPRDIQRSNNRRQLLCRPSRHEHRPGLICPKATWLFITLFKGICRAVHVSSFWLAPDKLRAYRVDLSNITLSECKSCSLDVCARWDRLLRLRFARLDWYLVRLIWTSTRTSYCCLWQASRHGKCVVKEHSFEKIKS